MSLKIKTSCGVACADRRQRTMHAMAQMGLGEEASLFFWISSETLGALKSHEGEAGRSDCRARKPKGGTLEWLHLWIMRTRRASKLVGTASWPLAALAQRG